MTDPDYTLTSPYGRYVKKIYMILQSTVAFYDGQSLPNGKRFDHAELTKQSLNTETSCIANLIFEYGCETGSTPLAIWWDFVEAEYQKHIDKPGRSSEIISYNNECYRLFGYHVTEQMDLSTTEQVGYHLCVTKFSTDHFYEAIDEEIGIASHKICCVIQNGTACMSCGSLILLEGYCEGCTKYYNEPGCKRCGCAFGRLTDGVHARCVKKRRLN
jgi:hypothetical protein